MRAITNQLFSRQGNVLPLAIVTVVVVSLLIDMYLAKFYGFSQTSYIGANGIFLVLSVICVAGQQFILGFIKEKSKTILENSKKLRLMFKSIRIAQYVLGSIFAILILQIYLAEHYSSFMAVLATIISYSFSLAVLVLLTQQFVSWYKTNRNRIVLLYTLASASLCVNLVIAIILVAILSQSLNSNIYPTVSRFIPNAPHVLNVAYVISTSLVFTITWIATATLMRHYSKKMGKLLYWFIMAIPLAYFLSQFVFILLNRFPIFSDVVSSVVIITMFFSLLVFAGP